MAICWGKSLTLVGFQQGEMECHSSGKGKVLGTGSSGEPSSVAGGSSNTYVFTTGGRQIKLKGAIEDTWSHGTLSGTNGFKCGYCSVGQKSGGKTRLTEHLCGLSGNVKPCSHVPPNVKTILLNQVALAKKKKRDIKENRLYIEKALMEHDYRTTLTSLDEDAQASVSSRPRRKPSSRHQPTPIMAPPPSLPPPQSTALPEDLVEDILLRFPPDEPASLLRATLVCKPWCRLISGSIFRRSFRELHRTPPMLGFFCNNSYEGNGYEGARFVPSTAFCPSGRFDWNALDARHGRVLVQSYVPDKGNVLVVWDPITDEQRVLPSTRQPTIGLTAVVLCAGASAGVCHHIDCHRGPFLVVFVGFELYEAFVCTYSSDVDA